MRRVSVSEAKAKLSELLRTAERGETVLIVRHGRPVARLTPPSPWPDSVSETCTYELDLHGLERAGIIRRAREHPDPHLLERPELALPPTDGLLGELLRDVETNRDDRF